MSSSVSTSEYYASVFVGPGYRPAATMPPPASPQNTDAAKAKRAQVKKNRGLVGMSPAVVHALSNSTGLIEPTPSSDGNATVGLVASNGTTDSNCSSAAVFRLTDGQLFANDMLISAPANVSQFPFGGASIDYGISRTWYVGDDTILRWGNASFDSGLANFCVFPNNTMLVIFHGPYPYGCTSLILYTEGCKYSPYPSLLMAYETNLV